MLWEFANSPLRAVAVPGLGALRRRRRRGHLHSLVRIPCMPPVSCALASVNRTCCSRVSSSKTPMPSDGRALSTQGCEILLGPRPEAMLEVLF